MRAVECNARTAEDVRLHAEKAAFEGQPLRTFFNSLQARTVQKLSPETRLFAEVCYEKKLAQCLALALIECAKSDEGREKAKEISNTALRNDLRTTWKPLIDLCSKLLRSLKMEATNARLSRLSDLWSKSENGESQTARMSEVVQHVIYSAVDRATRVSEDIQDWIELNSIQHPPVQETTRFVNDDELRTWRRNIVVVDRSETFSEAEAFLERETVIDSRIYVIIGNEDDGARFYKRIFDRFSSYGILLKWKGKEYGRLRSPKIVIGNIEFFTSHFSGRCDQTRVAAAVLHAECNLEGSFGNRFVPGNLDAFLSKLFVLTTITMEHVHEIEETVTHGNYNLTDLINSWPSENQNADDCITSFIRSLDKYASQFIEAEAKKYSAPHHLRGYLEIYRSKFVLSARVARDAKIGQDYIVYSERTSLSLRVRAKKQLHTGFGLLQFLELRHGCSMTSYRHYDRVLIIQRSNAFRFNRDLAKSLDIHNVVVRQIATRPLNSLSSPNHFPITVSVESKDCLFIIVCCTNQLLDDTFNRLNDFKDVNVCICETELGVLNESSKNPTGTLVVCTTSVCFEGWKIMPSTRKALKIRICHQRDDVAALEVACDLTASSEVESIILHSDYLNIINGFNRGREPSNISLREMYERAKSILFEGGSSEPEDFIEEYSKEGEINELLKAKRALHRSLKQTIITAKMVYARLPTKRLKSSDSPMDISEHGFLEQSREKIREVNVIRREVERLLINHGKKKGLSAVKMDKNELKEIANRYAMLPNDLSAFVDTFRTSTQLESWSDIRSKIELQFILKYDASEGWENFYHDKRRSTRTDIGLVALSSECVSAATTFLQHLRLVAWPDNYRELFLQCSDRHLEECTLYEAAPELDLDGLLQMDGASFEYIAPVYTASDIPNGDAINAAAKNCSLYLYPRRSYDRLTRDIFDGGLLICKDYLTAENNMHQYDTIQLPLIIETKQRSMLEKLLIAESALMEYGSLQWMEWVARRLRYFNYYPDIVRFYHKTVAERDYCAQDERLINRLREAFEKNERTASSSEHQMIIDAFVYSTMDTLEKFDRLVVIDPSFACQEAVLQLEYFIRSRRMAPAYFSDR